MTNDRGGSGSRERCRAPRWSAHHRGLTPGAGGSVRRRPPTDNQLSNGKIDSDQLRALLALFGLPDHLDAGQLQDLLQQLGGGHLLDGAGADSSSRVET